MAAGVDVRLPTGDALNFLGSGATGVKPFGVVSYKARISPHAEVGYEWNGDSTLAGTNIVPAAAGTTPTNTGKLPNRFVYIVGADIRVVKRLTAAFDIYGQRLFNSPEIISQPYMGLGTLRRPHRSDWRHLRNVYRWDDSSGHRPDNYGRYNITEASLGLKYRLVGRLVITGNVLLKLDEGGLRSNAVPLVGISYNF